MSAVPRLVAFTPHPDDESYSFGGTLALAAEAGWQCTVVCASSGEKGKRHDGGPTDRPAVAAQRERELEESCKQLGANQPVCVRLPDGGLRSVAGGREIVAALFNRMAPDLVLTLGADGAYGHPDHIALHNWVVQAWDGAGRHCPLLFPVFPRGLFLPQYEKCIGMMGDPPNPPAGAIGSESWQYEVDIRSVRDRKLSAIGSHHSQLPGDDPEAIFPPGIVASLLDAERFEDASGSFSSAVEALLASFAPAK